MSGYADVVDETRVEWRRQFGGGMVPFDTAYLDALEGGAPAAEAQTKGVEAVLDAFCEELKGRLS